MENGSSTAVCSGSGRVTLLIAVLHGRGGIGLARFPVEARDGPELLVELAHRGVSSKNKERGNPLIGKKPSPCLAGSRHSDMLTRLVRESWCNLNMSTLNDALLIISWMTSEFMMSWCVFGWLLSS
jgi:hypothetical protein